MKKLIVFSIVLFSSICFAQKENIYFTQTDIAEGLPGNHPYHIIEDRFGYLWITAETGLFRYNGYEYENFLPDKNDPHAFKGKIAYSICKDAKGRIWIFSDQALQYYDYDIGGFTMYKDMSNSSFNFDGALAAGRDSSVFVTFADQELYKIDKYDKFIRILYDSAAGPVIKNPPGDIVVDKFNRLWIAQPHSIAVYNQKENSISYILVFDTTSVKNAPDTYNSNYSTSFYNYHDKEFWFNTPDNRIFSANIDGKITVTEFKLDNALQNILKGNAISGLYIDRNKYLWIATLSRTTGLLIVNLKTGSFKEIKAEYGVAGKMSNNSIGQIFKDRSGTVWLTTGRSGMTRWDPYADKFTKIFDGSKNKINGNIYYLFPLSDGNIIVTDHYGNVFKVNPRNGSILQRITIRKGNGDPANNRVDFAKEWKNNEVLIHSTNGYLYNYFFVNNTLNKLRLSSRNKIPESVYLRFLGKNNTAWFSGSYDGRSAIYSYDLNSGKSNAYFPLNAKEEHRFSLFNYTYSVMQDRLGRIWTGTNGRGFFRFDPETKKFMRINDPLLTTVRISVEGSDGNIWAGSDQGLFIITPEGNVIKKLTSKDGLLHELIIGLAEDNNKNMWVQTERGLSRVNMNDYSIRNFGENDGYPIKNFNYNLKKLNNGDIAFTSDNNILKISPDHILDNKIPPVISINKLEISGKEITPGNSNVLHQYIGSTKKIELAYDQNDIDLSYIGIHYSRSDRINYSYFLKGYDSGWRNVGHQRSARYTNLSPGTYVFMVKAQNADGVWDKEPAELTIIISPPLWKTWWAYVFYVFAFVGILGGARKIELDRRKEKENKRILQLENKRKTQELEEARKLQLSMLPESVPHLPNLDIAVYMQTATEVGGDYYDFSIGLDGTLNIAFGDATGHGMQAGTLVTIMKGIFTLEAGNNEVIPFFNKSVEAIKEIKLGRLMMAFAFLKIKGNQLSLSNAGVPPVYIYRKDKNEVEEIDNKGMPLGAMINFPYKETKTELNKGDVIYLLSDGFPELSNNDKEIYGYERVKNILKKFQKTPRKKLLKN